MSNPRRRSLETTAVHAGREEFVRLGVHAAPLDLSTTYPVPDMERGGEDLAALAEGASMAGSSVYARLHNPTVARAERALAALEGGEACVAYGSGMAALTALLLAVRAASGRPSVHVVAVRPLYGGSDHLLASGLLPVETTFVTQDGVAAAMRPDTALVLAETPANPTLELVDVAAIVAAAAGVPVAVDSTFATPVLQRPLGLGARYVLHSATKFLGGHGDVMGGCIVTSEALAAPLRQVRIATGAVLHPLAGYLLHRGLATLPVRVRAAQETAQLLALRLAAHPSVARVHYPGLPGSDPRGLVGRQMAGPGALVSFEPHGGRAAAVALVKALELITPAVSLGSTDTLIQHPASLTHRLVGEEGRAEGGISEGLLRLSVGLEDVDDLWADLARALESSAARRRERPASRWERVPALA